MRGELRAGLDAAIVLPDWEFIEETERVDDTQVVFGDDTLVLIRTFSTSVPRDRVFADLKAALREQDQEFHLGMASKDGSKRVILDGNPFFMYLIDEGTIEMHTAQEF